MRRGRTRGSAGTADPADAQAAQLQALRLLARRDLAPQELTARLTARGFAANTAREVLAGLAASGAVNAARYAENYVTWQSQRGHGPVRIAAELRQRGIESGLIEQALAAGPDWRQLALRTVRARFGTKPAESFRERARRARFLQYRGFSADHIRSATGADADLD